MWRNARSSGGALGEAPRRKGGQKEDEEPTKKKEWDVMICGDWDESDDSETMLIKEFYKFV